MIGDGKKCADCGGTVGGDAKTCHNCGHSFAATETEALTARIDAAEDALLALASQTFGDQAGHPFHGNQYKETEGSADKRRSEGVKADAKTKDRLARAAWSKANSRPGEPPKLMPR